MGQNNRRGQSCVSCYASSGLHSRIEAAPPDVLKEIVAALE